MDVTAASVRRVERASGTLATVAAQRMTDELRWFTALPAEERSWVGLVAQAGIRTFVQSLKTEVTGDAIAAAVFGAAPSELLRSVSLQQTVELVRLTVDTVEREIPNLADDPEQVTALREATLRFSREVAFAAAAVYARAAEQRGAWHARQQASLIESLIRGEAADSIRGRTLALGWTPPAELVVVVGVAPPGATDVVIDDCERGARHLGLQAIAGVSGDWLVVLAGCDTDVLRALTPFAKTFGKGVVVRSGVVHDVSEAVEAAHEALAGARVASAWPDAPSLVSAEELLPERALAGDATAMTSLLATYEALRLAGPDLEATVSTYLAQGMSVEATARATFLHANTVRYRLKKVTVATGLRVTDPRDAFVLQCALVVGRIHTK